MSRSAFGNISGVPWSTTPESSYGVVVESVQIQNNSEPKTLENEDGTPVLHVQDGEYTEVQFEARIKTAAHFGTNALRGSVITSLSDADVPVPLIVVENSHSKTKRDWQTCRMTCRYYGTDFTTGTLVTQLGGATTTTTTTTGA